jgi:hypothetical protein
MRIDVHAHYWTEDYLDLLADLGRPDTGVARDWVPAAAPSWRRGSR